MYRKITYSLIILFSFFIISNVEAKEKTNLYIFYGETCPYCKEEITYLKKIEKKYNNIKFNYIEVWEHEDNEKLLEKVKEEYDIKANGVPITIIDKYYFTGYTEYITPLLNDTLEKCNNDGCNNYIEDIKNNNEVNIESKRLVYSEEDKMRVDRNNIFFNDVTYLFFGVIGLSLLLIIVSSIIIKTKK